MPTREEKARASTSWRVFWPPSVPAARRPRALARLGNKEGLRRIQAEVARQGHSHFDLKLAHAVKYDAVSRWLLRHLPPAQEGYMIKLGGDKPGAADSTNQACQEKATTPRLEGAGAGGPADSAGQPHRRDASANEASSPSTPLWTPQAVEAAAAASWANRAPPAGLLALKLATLWENPGPKGLRVLDTGTERVSGETVAGNRTIAY